MTFDQLLIESRDFSMLYTQLQFKNRCDQGTQPRVYKLNTSATYRDDIKYKKTLKYLSVRELRVGHSHLVWQDLWTVSAVRKGVVKARFLTESICFSRIDTYLATRLLTQIVDYVNWRWRILVMSSLDVQPTMWYKQLLQDSLKRSS